MFGHTRRGVVRRLAGVGVVSLVAGLAVAGCSSGAGDQTGATGTEGSGAPATGGSADLAGKKVLVIPYWLDDFGTAFGTWIHDLFAEKGVDVTVFSAEGDTTKQLNSIESMLGASSYDAIIWQPIDDTSATTTGKRIQEAGIGQVIFNASREVGQDGLHVPQLLMDNVGGFAEQGRAAAQYVLDHPSLGEHAELAWLGAFPEVQICKERLSGMVQGMQEVDPDAEVVFQEGASSAADGNSKMADFITGGTPFNVFNGCGGTQVLGGVSALEAAGMGGVDADGVPTDVFILSSDGSPAELGYLWSKDSAVMQSQILGPKANAEAAVEMLTKLLTGEMPLDSDDTVTVGFQQLSKDCAKDRPIAVENFAPVKEFKVPECQ